MSGSAVILNVDDNDIGRYAKTRALERAGFTVVDAATGGDALRLVGELEPELVLLDVKLPDMNGLEVCSLIKAEHPRIMVLQISATFTDKNARIRGLDAGADSYVTQPIEADELVANVRALLRMRSAEEALRRLNETLEERVRERTEELADAVERLRAEAAQREAAEAALRQSQKMEAIGQLTGGVAHDFNNLLTVIRASADLLRRPGLPEEKKRRYVEAIAETSDRAALLTGQLLSFARRQALSPEVLNLAERVRSISAMLRTVVGSRIDIRIDAETEGCLVRADASQLETALVNMVVNARDAMDGEGALTVAVRCSAESPPEEKTDAPYVALEVSDTGCGIAEDQLSRVFEPFYTTKEVGRGTGLGLSQVYGFAKQSGGEIAIASEVGEGTTFTLYLPKVDMPASEREVPSVLAEIAKGAGTVLVVEDNLQVGEFAAQLLLDIGYEATLVGTAAEALEAVAADRYDLIFTDVVMPGMSGIELAAELRRRGVDIPIVLTSGYSHVLAAEGSHGLALLQKPYSAASLARVLGLAQARPGPS